jgi:hypothetical protein
MPETSSKPWPPPPDIESIRELVRAADPEGYLAGGAHADEYEPEEEEILAAIQHLPTTALVVTTTLPLIQVIWQRSFVLDDEAMNDRQPALLALAQQIEQFFGPNAAPQVRS